MATRKSIQKRSAAKLKAQVRNRVAVSKSRETLRKSGVKKAKAKVRARVSGSGKGWVMTPARKAYYASKKKKSKK